MAKMKLFHLTLILTLGLWLSGAARGNSTPIHRPTSQPITIHNDGELNKLPNTFHDKTVFLTGGEYFPAPKLLQSCQRIIFQPADTSRVTIHLPDANADRWCYTLSKCDDVEFRDLNVACPKLTGGFVNNFGSGNVRLVRVTLNQANLYWGHGAGDILIDHCKHNGTAKKYLICNFDAPCSSLTVKCGSWQQGREEAAIRTMQTIDFTLADASVIPYIQPNGQPWKEDLQVRSGKRARLINCDCGVTSIGFIRDPSIKNVMPLQRVDITDCKFRDLRFTLDFGAVYRDGKKIR
jgi:hypothetical protein